MSFSSVGLTNVLLACLTIVNLVILLMMYKANQKS